MFKTTANESEFSVSVDKNKLKEENTYTIDVILSNDVSAFKTQYSIDLSVTFDDKPKKEPVVVEEVIEEVVEAPRLPTRLSNYSRF